ncbi:MAG: murein biosynthesis integral membrane protein MurJ [Pseudomonadota bacterium]
MKPIRLASGFLTVGAWTFLSRIFGFVRDIMIAAFLGSGPAAEAFFVAFSLPNLFRRFFGEGAFNMAFIPQFSKRVEAGAAPRAYMNDAVAALAAILVALTALATVIMPWLVLAMASGFAGDERFDLAVVYSRITFPYILLISLAALLSGVLNATGRFAAAAAAPVLLNILLIGAMVLADGLGWNIGLTLAITVPIAGAAQLALLWQAAKRAGYAPRLQRPRFTAEMKELAIIAAPAALAGGVVQINLLVGRQVASFFDGAVVWLWFADRLYQLPLGVVGIAIGVVLLPDLSRRLAANDAEGGRNAFNRAAEISLALTVPAAVALLVVPIPIVATLFERGAFGPEDVAPTALALAIYALGLPAFVLQKVLQPMFFAREDTRSPLNYAMVAMVVNAVIAIGLAPLIGFVSAAIATTLAAWVMVVLLWRGSRNMGTEAALDARFRARAPKIIMASAAMGLVLYGVAVALAGVISMPLIRYVALAALVAAGGVSYAVMGQVIGAFRLSDLKSALRR